MPRELHAADLGLEPQLEPDGVDCAGILHGEVAVEHAVGVGDEGGGRLGVEPEAANSGSSTQRRGGGVEAGGGGLGVRAAAVEGEEALEGGVDERALDGVAATAARAAGRGWRSGRRGRSR